MWGKRVADDLNEVEEEKRRLERRRAGRRAAVDAGHAYVIDFWCKSYDM
jgi:hypothetical protein